MATSISSYFLAFIFISFFLTLLGGTESEQFDGDRHRCSAEDQLLIKALREAREYRNDEYKVKLRLKNICWCRNAENDMIDRHDLDLKNDDYISVLRRFRWLILYLSWVL